MRPIFLWVTALTFLSTITIADDCTDAQIIRIGDCIDAASSVTAKLQISNESIRCNSVSDNCRNNCVNEESRCDKACGLDTDPQIGCILHCGDIGLTCLEQCNADQCACSAGIDCSGGGGSDTPPPPPPPPPPAPPVGDPIPEEDDPEPQDPESGSGNPITPKPPVCNYPYTSGYLCSAPKSQNCLQSGKKLTQRPRGMPNGCGPAGDAAWKQGLTGFLGVFGPEFQQCCNNHDDCFGTCSFGDDTLFDTCNSNLLGCMVNACVKETVGGGMVSYCYGRAFAVAAAVEGGCATGAYTSAQDTDAADGACMCVDCDDTPMDTNTIVLDNPVDELIHTVCSAVADLAGDWTNFVNAVRRGLSVAHESEKEGLEYFSGIINTNSPSVSSKVISLSGACGHNTRRKHIPSKSKRQSVIKLSSYFTNIGSTDFKSYTCGVNTGTSNCDVARALLGIAGISRTIETYADDSITASDPGVTHFTAKRVTAKRSPMGRLVHAGL